MTSYFDCVVIGAGVSGMTSAIYLKRYNINVLLLEKAIYGGQINQTLNIENYPGYESIDGPTLSEHIYKQVKQLNIPYQYGNVLEIKKEQENFKIKTDLEEILTKTIVLATGRTPKKLELENEEQLIGRGLSFCATCDGMLYKDKEVIVVGGGNSAIEEALYLSNICKKVTIIHRREELRADYILTQKLKEKTNIEILYNKEVTKYQTKENKLIGIEIKDNQTEEQKTLTCDGIFLYIGFTPSTEYIKQLNIKTNGDYIEVDKNMQTNIKGIFACGDVINKEVYQIITAAGEGSIAANSVKKYLD